MIGSRGQMRTVEALLASGVIVAAMIIMINLTRSPDPYSNKVRNELTRYSYDFLMSLAEEEVLDKVVFESNIVREGWEGLMKNMLNALLPPTLLYNMTVYNMTLVGGYLEPRVEPRCLNTIPITNTSAEALSNSEESASAEIIYTTRSRWVLKIRLELAR